MDFVRFHKALVGSDPTPEQVNVYKTLETRHGTFVEERSKHAFLAVFVASLALTKDPVTKESRNVYLIMPSGLDDWATNSINELLAALRRKPIDPQKKAARNKGLVKALNHVLRGSRVMALTSEPERWVSYGFSESTIMPDWMRQGLGK